MSDDPMTTATAEMFMRQRNEALAEVERLRAENAALSGAVDDNYALLLEAQAEVERHRSDGAPAMTATRIVWSETMTLIVARELRAVQESFHEALENGGWVLIDASDGQKVSVNPSNVLYLEDDSRAR